MQSGAPQSTNLKINSFKEKKINKKTYLPYFSLRSIFLKHVSTKINTLRVPEGGGGGGGGGYGGGGEAEEFFKKSNKMEAFFHILLLFCFLARLPISLKL